MDIDDKARLLQQLRLDRGADDVAAVPRRGRQLLSMLAIAIGASALTWLVMRGFPHQARGGGAPATEPPAASAAAPAAAGAPELSLDASGYVVARRIATVSATIPGRLMAVLIDEGSKVKKGQVLARLDDTEARLELARAKAQLEQSRALLVQAQATAGDAALGFERGVKLHERGVVSQQELDTRKAASEQQAAAVLVAQRAIDAAQTLVDSAERYLRETVVRAPFDGVITEKQAQPGEIISPAAAGGGFTRTGIGTIVDMNSLEVEVDVSENFINRVRPGQAAEIRLNAYPDWAIPAEVIAIIPTADKAKATVKVRVGFRTRDERILPDMGARVSFHAPAAA